MHTYILYIAVYVKYNAQVHSLTDISKNELKMWNIVSASTRSSSPTCTLYDSASKLETLLRSQTYFAIQWSSDQHLMTPYYIFNFIYHLSCSF